MHSVSQIRAASIQGESSIDIGLSIYVFRTSEGEGDVTLSEIKKEVEFLNEVYSDAHINFFVLGDVNFIDADRLYYFDVKDQSHDQEEIDNLFAVDGAVNVYYVGPINEGASFPVGWCGSSYFPEEGIDKVLLSQSCASGSLLAHEMGHLFSLLHTHEKSFGEELVNGSNCEVAGDLLCDTPADPGITSDDTGGNCLYTGGAIDKNGNLYQPDASNLMSYAADECRTGFSPEQINSIVTAYNMYKTHLIADSAIARFSAGNRELCIGATVEFADLSIGASSYQWVFEGGAPATSREPSPKVMYQSTGLFYVELTITDKRGQTYTKKINDYIRIETPVATDIVSLSGGFEEEFIQERITNPDYRFTFEVNDYASSLGEQSAMINFYDYYESPRGQEDYLILGTVNNALLSTCHVSFDYAYAAVSNVEFDRLELVYRDPCSNNWTTLWSREGDQLQTSKDYVDDQLFVPEDGDWKNISFEIELPANIDLAEFAFRTQSGWGNALYLDNYSVNAVPERPEIIHDGSYLVLNADESLDVKWYYDGNLIDGASHFRLLADKDGVYEAEVTNGICSTRSNPLNIFTLSLNSATQSNLSLYPNPASDQLNIDVSNNFDWKRSTMTIQDMTGKTLISQPFRSKIDLLELKAGFYIFTLISDEVLWTRRFIKKS